LAISVWNATGICGVSQCATAQSWRDKIARAWLAVRRKAE
jgi:hypothetical protein